MSLIAKLLGEIKSPVVLEIGCADGEDSERFLEKIPDIQLHCFEPDSRGIAAFKARKLKCSLYEVAISDTDGTAIMFVSQGTRSDGREHIYSSSLLAPQNHITAHPSCSFIDGEAIKTVRLDTWSSQHDIDHVDFIWADVQGSERMMIEGGRETLAKTKYLYTEYNDFGLYQSQPTLKQIKAMLPDFEINAKWTNNVLFERKPY